MSLMKKSNLLFKNYSWTVYGDDDPKVTGSPDSTLFNRKEGYEVLYMLNKLAELHGYESVATGQRIERMIHDDLPGNIRSQENVRKWIMANISRS